MAKHGSTVILKADPDDPEDFDVTREALDHAIEERRRRGGRPKGSNKESISLRVDQDVLERYRTAGPGWQSRMNDDLRRAIGL